MATPATPSRIVVTAISDTEIDVFWSSSGANTEHYAITRGAAIIAIVPATQTVYHDTGLAAATEYCYTVYGTNSTENGTATASTCATTNGATTDNAIARYNGTGYILQNSLAILGDTGNIMTPGMIASKPAGAGIQLDPNAATGNFTLSLSPANLTAGRRVTFPDADITITAAAGGTGTNGRVAQWGAGNTLTNANLIGPAANVLTLTATAASTLALAITAGKAVTLTATDNSGVIFTGASVLTVPETMTAAGRNVNNTFTGLNTFNFNISDASGTLIDLLGSFNATSSFAYYWAAATIQPTVVINTGITVSGYLRGIQLDGWRRNASDLGTLANLSGLFINIGHYSSVGATARTTAAYGIYIAPSCQAGTIDTLYDLYIADVVTGGTLSAHYAIYSASTAASYMAGNVKIAGTAVRATTEGTAHIDIFNGTAPVGTLTNGISLYGTSGFLGVMDAAGNASTFGGGVHVGGTSDPGDNNLLVDGSIKAGAAAMFGGATQGQLSQQAITNLADHGKTLIGLVAADNAIAIIQCAGTADVAMYILKGGFNATTEVFDPSNKYSNTEDADGTTNIYWDAGNARYELNNELGATTSYNVWLFRNT